VDRSERVKKILDLYVFDETRTLRVGLFEQLEGTVSVSHGRVKTRRPFQADSSPVKSRGIIATKAR